MMTKLLNRKSEEFDLSRITLTSDPEYADAQTKLTELKTQFQAVDREISTVEAARARRVSATELMTARAEALLLDGAAPPAPSPSVEVLGQLYDRRTVIGQAIELQRTRLAAIRGRVSADICRRLLPTYRALVTRLDRVLAEVASAQDELLRFSEHLRDEDVDYLGHLRPMIFALPKVMPVEFTEREPFTAISSWRKEAREYQLIA